MKEIIVYLSDNGKKYDTEMEALKADASYWRDEFFKAKSKISKEPNRQAYAESGGHQ